MWNALRNSVFLIQMILVQPGGEGSVEEAQPILDSFSKLVSSQEIQFKTRYVNDPKKIAVALGSSDIAILPWDVYLEYQDRIPMEIFLSTKPVQGSTRESYYLVGGSAGLIYLSRSMHSKFLKEEIFKEAPQYSKLPTVVEPDTLGVLRKISESGEGLVLLSDFEYAVFKKLKMDWTKKIRTVFVSKPFPPAPVVLLKKISDSEKIKAALLSVENSQKGKEVLEELRLKGFANPQQ